MAIKSRVGRPAKSTIAPGVFKRGKTYWLRYSAGGEQIRVSLETSDPSEALAKADDLRGRPVQSKATGKIKGGKTLIEIELAKYLERKQKAGEMKAQFAENVGYAVTHFSEVTKITDPARITKEALKSYYTKAKELKSVSTAQTYTSRVGTFARGLGYRTDTPKFEEEATSRDVVIERKKVSELLELATNPELKFILKCGFLAGMRRGEIDMARPSWFDFGRGRINIPSPDTVTGWTPKSGRKRSIPLVPVFADWIQETFPDWSKRAFCLRPKKVKGKAKYRFDARKMFEGFAKKHCPELTPHVMRHTFTSVHANNPRVSIAQLSEWTGDRIATLEKHYIHLEADAEKAAASYLIPVDKKAEKKTKKAVKRVRETLLSAAEYADFGRSMGVGEDTIRKVSERALSNL
jgi:integrase